MATADETSSPPESLGASETIAKIAKGEGNNLWTVILPDEEARSILVEMPSRFRSTIWLKRGGFVVIDRAAFTERENKIGGEIVNVIRDEKQWRKQPYWPSSFEKVSLFQPQGPTSTAGDLPPVSDSEAE